MALDKTVTVKRIIQAGKTLANNLDEIRAVNFETTQSGFLAGISDAELTDLGVSKAELTAALATFAALETWWNTKAATVYAVKR